MKSNYGMVSAAALIIGLSGCSAKNKVAETIVTETPIEKIVVAEPEPIIKTKDVLYKSAKVKSATSTIPEWYKKLPTMLPNGLKKHIETETIKKCQAMHDWLSMGYLIRNRHSVFVFIGHDGNEPVSISLPLKDDVTPPYSAPLGEVLTVDRSLTYCPVAFPNAP